MEKQGRPKKTYILFGIYCILLVWVILLKLSFSVPEIRALSGTRSVNWIPFYYQEEAAFHLGEVLKNFIVFIPFGLYLKMIGVKNRTAAAYGLLFSFALELLQFIFGIGASDITDIMTNTLGTVTGVGVHVLLIKVFQNREKTDKILERLAGIATAALIALLLLLILAN